MGGSAELPAQARPGTSTIALNAPTAPAQAAAPSIVIQNVQAQQPTHPGFVPGMYKNPALALFLSIIFPGGGQFYNGHAGKGFLVLFTFWIFGITWVWSWFDAYGSAQRINRVGF
jgi:TM2 domain-containing membrane protein YozV